MNPGWRVGIVVIGDEEIETNPELLELRSALDSQRPRFGRSQRGQQHCGEDGDNGDDDEQFDQCEGGGQSARWPLAREQFSASGVFQVLHANLWLSVSPK